MSTSRTSPESDPVEPANDRLDSWKEIAAYFRRDESTVRRWEKDGLPVHRRMHKAKATVFAYRAELDAWWRHDPERSTTTSVHESATPRLHRFSWPVLIGLGITVVLVLIALRLLLTLEHGSPQPSPMTFTPLIDSEGELSYPAFSPDGKQVAFTWNNPELPGLGIYVKLIGGEAPLRLIYHEHSEDFAPVWSPDGKQIAFLHRSGSDAGIVLTSALGGAERTILSLRPDRYFAWDWSADGKTIAFARRQSADDPYCIFLLSLEDGGQRQITFPSGQSYGDPHFAFSPDGRSLAFIRYGEPSIQQMSVEVLPLGAAAKPQIIASYREWIGNLAWGADSQSLIVTGQKQGVRKLWQLFLQDRREVPLLETGENAYFPAVARQGNRLAFVREVEDTDLWRAELSAPAGPAKPARRVIFSTRVEGAPRFSPDGRKISFMSYRSGFPELWVSNPDGTDALQLTSFKTQRPQLPTWAPDGQTIAFADGRPFHIISAAGGQPRRLTGAADDFNGPSWSRDGSAVYYWRKGEGERSEIWKAPVAGGPAVRVVNNGLSSMESPDGKFLYFTRVPGIWRVPVSGGEETLVVEGQPPQYPGYWSVFDDGIYILHLDASQQPTIQFFNFETRRSTPVLTLSGAPDPWRGGLTVSPDRRSIMFSQLQYSSSEIVLAENFR